MPHYFAYGSNLDPNQMRRRCPSARFCCVAKLLDYQLTFPRGSAKRGCGVAGIVPARGHMVWGTVYTLDAGDLAHLDGYEDFDHTRSPEHNAYNRHEVTVCTKDPPHRSLQVQTYFAVAQSDPPPPNAEYMGHIIRGATHWGLPPAYVAELERIQ